CSGYGSHPSIPCRRSCAFFRWCGPSLPPRPRFPYTTLFRSYPALVIGPAHAEQDLPLRLDDAFDDAVFAITRLGIEQRLQAVEYFAGGLVELVLCRAAVLQTSQGLLDEQGHVRLPLSGSTCRRRA